jgi:GR25 family glycosyltransferase involved in LPS biosynthesis
MIHAAVINLDRASDRLADFQGANPGLAFERFPAVLGAARPREAWVSDGLLTAENRYSNGAIGCAASHVALWRRVAAAGEPLHVLEDDVILRRDFLEASEALLADLPTWDIVCWTWNYDWPLRYLPAPGLGAAWLQLDPYAIKPRYGEFREATPPSRLLKLVSAGGTPCYTIAPEGAAKLLARCLPFGNEGIMLRAGSYGMAWTNTGLDVEMSRHYGDLAAFIAIPPLATAINDPAGSTTRTFFRAGG